MKYFFTSIIFTLISFESYAGVHLGDNYEIFVGTLNAKEAHIETFKGDVSFKADINFVSDTEATLSVLDCTPVDECDFRSGSVLAFKKFF